MASYGAEFTGYGYASGWGYTTETREITIIVIVTNKKINSVLMSIVTQLKQIKLYYMIF